MFIAGPDLWSWNSFHSKPKMDISFEIQPEIARLALEFVTKRSKQEHPLSEYEVVKAKSLLYDFISIYYAIVRKNKPKEESDPTEEYVTRLQKLDDHHQILVLTYMLGFPVEACAIDLDKNMDTWAGTVMFLDVVAHVEAAFAEDDECCTNTQYMQWKLIVYVLTQAFIRENPGVLEIARQRAIETAEKEGAKKRKQEMDEPEGEPSHKKLKTQEESEKVGLSPENEGEK